jgi:N utilization substance protein B
VIRDSEALSADLTPCLDRPIDQLSPVERAVLLVAAFELKNQVDIPYRVVINEAVELAKTFGGADGYKYVNGVLDKLAAQLRVDETQAARKR